MKPIRFNNNDKLPSEALLPYRKKNKEESQKFAKEQPSKTAESIFIGDILDKYNLTVDLVHNKSMTKRIYKAMEEYARLRVGEEKQAGEKIFEDNPINYLLNNAIRHLDNEQLKVLSNSLIARLPESQQAVIMPTEEDINKKVFQMCSEMRPFDGKTLPKTTPEYLMEFANWFKSQIKVVSQKPELTDEQILKFANSDNIQFLTISSKMNWVAGAKAMQSGEIHKYFEKNG